MEQGIDNWSSKILVDDETNERLCETKKTSETLRKIFDIGLKAFGLGSKPYFVCSDGDSAQRSAFNSMKFKDDISGQIFESYGWLYGAIHKLNRVVIKAWDATKVKHPWLRKVEKGVKGITSYSCYLTFKRMIAENAPPLPSIW